MVHFVQVDEGIAVDVPHDNKVICFDIYTSLCSLINMFGVLWNVRCDGWFVQTIMDGGVVQGDVVHSVVVQGDGGSTVGIKHDNEVSGHMQ